MRRAASPAKGQARTWRRGNPGFTFPEDLFSVYERRQLIELFSRPDVCHIAQHEVRRIPEVLTMLRAEGAALDPVPDRVTREIRRHGVMLEAWQLILHDCTRSSPRPGVEQVLDELDELFERSMAAHHASRADNPEDPSKSPSVQENPMKSSAVVDQDTPDVRVGQTVVVQEYPAPARYRVTRVSPTIITIEDGRRFRRYPTKTKDALNCTDDQSWIVRIGSRDVIGRSPDGFDLDKDYRRGNPGRSEPDTGTLEKAREWAVHRFYAIHDGRTHPSLDAERVLEEAADRFGIEHNGVEGFSDDVGRHGVSYLNMGDSYDVTLLALTSPRSVRFRVGSWGDLVESDPRWSNPGEPPPPGGRTCRVEIEITDRDAERITEAQRNGQQVRVEVGGDLRSAGRREARALDLSTLLMR